MVVPQQLGEDSVNITTFEGPGFSDDERSKRYLNHQDFRVFFVAFFLGPFRNGEFGHFLGRDSLVVSWKQGFLWHGAFAPYPKRSGAFEIRFT